MNSDRMMRRAVVELGYSTLPMGGSAADVLATLPLTLDRSVFPISILSRSM